MFQGCNPGNTVWFLPGPQERPGAFAEKENWSAKSVPGRHLRLNAPVVMLIFRRVAFKRNINAALACGAVYIHSPKAGGGSQPLVAFRASENNVQGRIPILFS